MNSRDQRVADTMYTIIARPQKKMFQTINSTTVLLGEMYQLPGFELHESLIKIGLSLNVEGKWYHQNGHLIGRS
jgi:hypothetical protein